MGMKMNNILVVYKKSAFELYSASPDEKTREFMAQNSKDVKRMKRSHEAQKKTLDVITTELERRNIKYEAIYRADLEDIDRELVIVVGGDGTVLEVSHYVKNTPILGVNSDPGFASAIKTSFTTNSGRCCPLSTSSNLLKVVLG